MRIAVSSTACNGKTFFINSFLKRWPMYKTPPSTYRDLIESKNLTLNMGGSLESQKIIRDALADQAINNSKEPFCIHDRCILDNLVYSLWLSEKGIIDDDKFMEESFALTRESLKFYDIILFLPITPLSPISLEEKETRELDENYRSEINTLFLAIEQSYKEREGIVFPLENSPALIEIFGDETRKEKTELVSFYLNSDGTLKGSDENLIKSISEISQEDALTNALLNQVGL
jgi:hypothetical protein